MSRPFDHEFNLADAAARRVMAGSRAGRWLSAGLDAMGRAWQHSAARRLADFVTPVESGLSSVERIRFWAVTAITASLVATAGARLGTTPQPLGRILPTVCGVTAAALLVWARRGRECERGSE